MLLKREVTLSGLTAIVYGATFVVDEAFINITGDEAICTSTWDGLHMARSKHYKGEAFDCRLRQYPKKNSNGFDRDDIRLAVQKNLDAVYGLRVFQVMFGCNDTILHIEYDQILDKEV